MRVVLEREERRDVAIGHEPDVATPATIAAIGAALGHVGLTPECDAAGAAIATAHVQLAFVDEP